MLNKETVEDFLKTNENKALKEASNILNKKINHQSFNGIIGSKNYTYNIHPQNYSSYEDYICDWLNNFNEIYKNEKNSSYEKSSHRMYKLLQNDFLKKYIKYYLIKIYFNKK